MPWPALVAVGVLGAIGMLAACGGGASDAANARTAGVYVAVVQALADPPAAKDQTPVVFVVPRPGSKSIPLEVQTEVVHQLTDHVAVRFVDDDDEAIDTSAAGRPVKQGVLVRVSPIAPTGDPIELVADRYHSATDQATVTLRVRSVGQKWSAEVLKSVPGPP